MLSITIYAMQAGPKKRAVWDYKGRLEDMEKLALFLKEKTDAAPSASFEAMV